MECPLWDPVQDLKYLIVLYIVKERENDRWIGASCSDADVSPVKRSESDDLLVDLHPTSNFGLELWVATERMRLWTQVAQMNFLQRLAGLSLRNKVKSSIIKEEL